MLIRPDDSACPVAQRLDASNARDVDRFTSWRDTDCRSYAFAHTLLA